MAAVGLTLEAAERAAGHDGRPRPGRRRRRLALRRRLPGKARVVFDLDRQVLVGASFVGPGVAELLHSATVAVVGEVPIDRLWHAVPAYPTISEVWLRLLEGCRG
ncbi:hypothetical protein ACFQ0M_13955 [Kitasatospora aburaviensis]